MLVNFIYGNLKKSAPQVSWSYLLRVSFFIEGHLSFNKTIEVLLHVGVPPDLHVSMGLGHRDERWSRGFNCSNRSRVKPFRGDQRWTLCRRVDVQLAVVLNVSTSTAELPLLTSAVKLWWMEVENSSEQQHSSPPHRRGGHALWRTQV